MKKKKTDSRINHTHQSLHTAIVSLIKEKHYDAITIQNIIDRAEIGRSTFYSHFDNKDDLFLSGWQRLLDWIVGNIQWENLHKGRFMPVREFFSHVRDFHQFQKGLVRSQKMDTIFRTGQAYLAKQIENELKSMQWLNTKRETPLSVLSNYLASEIFALLKWWLDHDMSRSPEQMDKLFDDLVMPGFRSFLKAQP